VRARELLSRLRVNPSAAAAAAGRPAGGIPPLAVPLTLALQAGSVSVALLAAAAAAVAAAPDAAAAAPEASAAPDTAEELGSLQCSDLKVQCLTRKSRPGSQQSDVAPQAVTSKTSSAVGRPAFLSSASVSRH